MQITHETEDQDRPATPVISAVQRAKILSGELFTEAERAQARQRYLDALGVDRELVEQSDNIERMRQ